MLFEGDEEIRLNEELAVFKEKNSDGITIRMVNRKEETLDVAVRFSDGEVITTSVGLLVPDYESAREISEDEYVSLNENELKPINYDGKNTETDIII